MPSGRRTGGSMMRPAGKEAQGDGFGGVVPAWDGRAMEATDAGRAGYRRPPLRCGAAGPCKPEAVAAPPCKADARAARLGLAAAALWLAAALCIWPGASSCGGEAAPAQDAEAKGEEAKGKGKDAARAAEGTECRPRMEKGGKPDGQRGQAKENGSGREGRGGGEGNGAAELSAAEMENAIEEIRAGQSRLRTLAARIETREYDSLAEETVVRKGTLAVKFPDRIRRDFTEPKKYSWILSGWTLYEYLPDLKEAYRTDFAKGNKAAAVLAAALSMDLKGLREHFSMRAFRTGDGTLVIRMVPVRPEWAKSIAWARVEIPAGGIFMRRMEIAMRSGDGVTDIYSDIVPDGRVEDGAFDFVPQPGVRVIERKVE